MRERALFGTMFGLGAGAVLVGVTVSRLVVGQAPEKPPEEPPTVAAQARTTVVAPAAQPPPQPAIRRQHRALARKHRRPPVVEEAPAPPSLDMGVAPIAVVRGGPAPPIQGSSAPGPRVIQVDPVDGR